MEISRALLISSVVIFAACAHQSSQVIILERTPILVRVPAGFVHSPWISTDSPSLYFNLPRGPDGGTPMRPQLSVTEVNPIRAPKSVSSYVAALQSNDHAKVFLGPRNVSVLGVPAAEIATEWTAIYDFEDGTAASGQTTRHEIIFELRGRYYICELSAYPEIHPKWAPSLHELCDNLSLSVTSR